MVLLSPPIQKPYVILPRPTDAASYLAKIPVGRDRAVTLDGDVLTFLHRRKVGYVGVTGGVQESMQPIPNSDGWILRLRMAGWNKATLQYAFFTPDHPAPTYEEYRVWRGPQAPQVSLARPLQGRLQHFEIQSAALGEARRVTVYLPPNARPGIPAFFMADGEGAEGMAQALEPLILQGRVQPAAIVGIYSGDWNGKGRRGAEYGNMEAKHFRFFTQEVPTWAAKTFRISTAASDHTLMGFSSGASFVCTVKARKPDAFGTVIALAGSSRSLRKQPGAQVYFATGTLDPSYGSTVAAARRLGAPCDVFIGGHDFEIWRLGFASIAPRVFPPRR